MTDRRHFFAGGANLELDANVRWEEQVVSRLLTVLGLTKLRPQLRQAEAERTGVARLTLVQFFEFVPQFPVFLISSAMYKIAEDATIQRLFQRFEKTRLYQTFDNSVDLLPPEREDAPYGLVVRWPYLKNGLIIHDASVDMYADGFRMFYYQNRRGLTLEPFDSFLERMLENTDEHERET